MKYAKRPLSTVETFALRFAPILNEKEVDQQLKGLNLDPPQSDVSVSAASEVSMVSVHAMDVLAEIYAEKEPNLAKLYLQHLAEKYDTMRKGYWNFLIEKLQKAG